MSYRTCISRTHSHLLNTIDQTTVREDIQDWNNHIGGNTATGMYTHSNPPKLVKSKILKEQIQWV